VDGDHRGQKMKRMRGKVAISHKNAFTSPKPYKPITHVRHTQSAVQFSVTVFDL